MRTLALVALLIGLPVAAEHLVIDVHRDAHCSCCSDWIKHLQNHGFSVNDHLETNMSLVKQQLGVPPRLASCHTAVINGQFVEGHVPAHDILKLISQPTLLGAAVPGMPHGSPGMETGIQQAYQVIGLEPSGQEHVLAEYPKHSNQSPDQLP